LTRDNRRLNTIEEKTLKNFRNSIEVGDRAVIRGKRLIKTWLFEEKSDKEDFKELELTVSKRHISKVGDTISKNRTRFEKVRGYEIKISREMI